MLGTQLIFNLQTSYITGKFFDNIFFSIMSQKAPVFYRKDKENIFPLKEKIFS